MRFPSEPENSACPIPAAITGITQSTWETVWSRLACTTTARQFQRFHFPDRMRGMTVLDAGSATGFFAFEFERRGARVVSRSCRRLSILIGFPGRDVEGSLQQNRAHDFSRAAS